MRHYFYQSCKLLGVILLLSFSPSEISKNKKTDSEDYCRMTCTIFVEDGFGGFIGISATAGGIFTSCETALSNACKKVAQTALNMM